MSRTVALTQVRTHNPIHFKVQTNPDPDGDGDGGEDSFPSPNPDSPNYHQLECNNTTDIKQILFTFELGEKLQTVVKDKTDSSKILYLFAKIPETVYNAFKKLTIKTGEFIAVRPHLFKFSKKTKKITTLRILYDPETVDEIVKGKIWCFVRCENNRIKVIPFSLIQKYNNGQNVALERYISAPMPVKPTRGRPSSVQVTHREIAKELDKKERKEAIKLNFERETNDANRHIASLQGCPPKPQTRSASKKCTEAKEKACKSAETFKHPGVMAAIHAYGKRVDKANALCSWEEICDSVEPPAHAQTVGGFPYIIKPVTEGKTKGFKVCKGTKPEKCFSKHPLPKERAQKQRVAITLSELSRRRAGAKPSEV